MPKDVFFENSKGNKIAATLSVVNDGMPTIIICHGLTSSRKGSALELIEKLNSKGLNAFSFDFYGHGDSEGKFEDITVSEGVDDILCAVKYLKDMQVNKIGLLGTSFGGACSIIAASQLNGLCVLALRSPVADYYIKELMTKSKKELIEWKMKGFRIYEGKDGKKGLNYKFLEDTISNRGLEVANKITTPTLIVHGNEDTVAPIILSEMLEKVIQNCTLQVIQNADHRYSDPKLDVMAVNYLIDFIVNTTL